MVLGKGVQLIRAKIRHQHRSAKGDDIALRQKSALNGRKIAMPADEQRIMLLASYQCLPVNVCQ